MGRTQRCCLSLQEEINVARAHLELKVARNVGDNKKGFIKYINGKKQYWNSISLLQDENGHLINRNMD